MHTYILTYTHTCRYACISVCVYLHSHMHADMHINTQVCTHTYMPVGRGGALVESMPFRPEGRGFESSSSRDIGQVLHLQLPVSLRRVNSDTVSFAVVGNAFERLML